VTFQITPDMLALVNQEGQSILEPGSFKITLGGACPSPRAQALGAAKTVEVMLTVGE
jgi:beta-glucosidase